MKTSTMLGTILLTFIFSTSCVTSSAQSKENLASKFLYASGMESTGKQIIDQIFAGFGKQNPQVSEEFFTKLRKEVSGKDLVKIMAPVYANNYTTEELVEINKYSNSAGGKKSSALLGQAMSEINTYEILQKNGQEKGREIFQRKVADYMKANMSPAEYAQMSQFEKSTVGQKLANPSPEFTKELNTASQKWGMKIGSKVVEKMQSKK